MELYQLNYFLEAARQRSFTRAARQLHLAQSALSEQMRKLEDDLGTRLFDRSRKETLLTPAGEVLRQHAEILLDQASAARRAIHEHLTMKTGYLTIGAIPTVSSCVLPIAISRFRKKHPMIELSLLEGTSSHIAQWVEEGRVDLGLVQLPVGDHEMTTTILFREAFSLLLHADHPSARKRKIALSALRNETFIFYKGRARDVVREACRKEGFDPHGVCESGELETIRSLVGTGMGIAVLPELANKRIAEHTRVIPLEGCPIEREVAMLEKKHRSSSPAAIAMKRILQGLRVD
jgi:DNA-binding transcriptional LysR family regulator